MNVGPPVRPTDEHLDESLTSSSSNSSVVTVKDLLLGNNVSIATFSNECYSPDLSLKVKPSPPRPLNREKDRLHITAAYDVATADDDGPDMEEDEDYDDNMDDDDDDDDAGDWGAGDAGDAGDSFGFDGRSAFEGSLFDDDSTIPAEEWDSDDERQTEALERYVLTHACAAPPKADVVTGEEDAAQTSDVAPKEFVPDERRIRATLLDMAAQNRCWGRTAARKMKFKHVTPSPALHYFLESFSESRAVHWRCDPFEGQPVDGPENGDPPDPWTVPFNPAAFFTPEVYNVEVPHTASVRNCVSCRGKGASKCFKCKSKRMLKCTKCGGSGKTMKQGRRAKCPFCHGRGKKKCATCGGDGKQKCKTCSGYCKLKYCVMLTVSFNVHKSDHLHEATSISPDVLQGAQGECVFEQTRDRVTPLTAHSVAEVNTKSQELLCEHEEAMQGSRVLRQRHALVAVPVTEVKYEYKGKDGIFWLHGLDLNCHFPDYPEQTLWGCQIS